MRLDGKIAIVTGSGRGLGRSLAQAMAGAGAKVLVSDVEAEHANETVRSIRAAGGTAESCLADVTSGEQVRALVQHAVKVFGRLDVMVNNAGRSGLMPFLEMTEKDWDRVLDTNLRGTFLCCHAAATQMVRQGGCGKIINVTSAIGIKGAKSAAHYAASKGGVVALTRSLAAELAPHRIEVMAAGPGQTDTPMWRSMYTEEEQAQRIKAGQLRSPEEFTSLVLFLASEAGNGWSGEVIARGVYNPT
ncbi:MAG: SDR family oxidoreductase [Betaproteobacteria bacterium]|nr:SDR family oxidoreductase [Betaproteobacteria bacterium]